MRQLQDSHPRPIIMSQATKPQDQQAMSCQKPDFNPWYRPANFEKHKFVFWHPKIRILYQKIVFFKTNISERILNIYSTNFSYGKWMQEGLPNSTGSCELARECKIIKVLHNKKEQHKLDIFWQQIHRYILPSIIWCQLHRLSSSWSTVPYNIQYQLAVARPVDKTWSFPHQILSDSGQNDDL